MITLSALCGFLPQILISPFAGVWIDRWDRKKLILLSDSATAAATLLLALAFFAGHSSTGLLFAALIIRSAGAGIQTPAVQAVLPQIVPAGQLMRINGIQSTLSSVILFLSPAVSGAILSVAPLEATLFIDVVTAFIGVGITAIIEIPPYEKKISGKNSYWKEIRSGMVYLKENRFLKRLLVFQLTILFLISPSAFLTPLMVSRTFGGEVWRLTASEMTYSLGMIGGGFLIAAWGGFRRSLHTTLLAGALYGICMIGLGAAPVFWLYLICNTWIGITSPCYNAPITATIQEKVTPGMQGRVFSFMQIAASCALPFGMVLFGPLADLFRVQTLFLASGTIVTALCALAYMTSYLDNTN
jgi:DHA3 family macrolide efflux protein-like MFS transporter